MTPRTPQLLRNRAFRFINLAKGNRFLSLTVIPFLVVLVASLAVQPAVGASPVFKTIPVGAPGSLEGIIADPSRSVVYVADRTDFRIAVIDTISNQILFFISTTNEPIGLALSSDNSTLYVTEDQQVSPFNGFLEAFSLTTFEQLYLLQVNSSPALPAAASDGSTVYVPCQGGPGTVVPVGGPLLGKPIIVGSSPVDVVFNHNNTSAYVTTVSNKIAVINTATGAVNNITTANLTFGLIFKGKTLYATGEGVIYVINTPSNTIVDTISLPKPATGEFVATFPALTPDRRFLYVPLAEVIAGGSTLPANTILVIDTQTNTIRSSFTVGEAPIQVAASANDTNGYSSNVDDGTVSVFTLLHGPPF